MNLKPLFCIIFFVPMIASANTCYTTSGMLIKDLYRKFPIGSLQKSIYTASPEQVHQFFSKKLANLFIKDQKCSKRINGVCNIEFDVLTYGQDLPDKNKYQILQNADSVVTVMVEYSDQPTFIEYKISNYNGKCKLIDNITYNNNESLLNILSR